MKFTEFALAAFVAIGFAPRAGADEMSREQALRVFDLPRGASADQIAVRRRELIIRLHPDRNGGDGGPLAQVNAAYDRLTNKPRVARGEGAAPRRPPASPRAERPWTPPPTYSFARQYQRRVLVGIATHVKLAQFRLSEMSGACGDYEKFVDEFATYLNEPGRLGFQIYGENPVARRARLLLEIGNTPRVLIVAALFAPVYSSFSHAEYMAAAALGVIELTRVNYDRLPRRRAREMARALESTAIDMRADGVATVGESEWLRSSLLTYDIIERVFARQRSPSLGEGVRMRRLLGLLAHAPIAHAGLLIRTFGGAAPAARRRALGRDIARRPAFWAAIADDLEIHDARGVLDVPALRRSAGIPATEDAEPSSIAAVARDLYETTCEFLLAQRPSQRRR